MLYLVLILAAIVFLIPSSRRKRRRRPRVEVVQAVQPPPVQPRRAPQKAKADAARERLARAALEDAQAEMQRCEAMRAEKIKLCSLIESELDAGGASKRQIQLQEKLCKLTNELYALDRAWTKAARTARNAQEELAQIRNFPALIG